MSSMKNVVFLKLSVVAMLWSSTGGGMGQVSIDLKPSRHGLPEGMPYFQATPLWEGSLFLEPEQVLYSMDPDCPGKAKAATYWPDGSVQWLQVSGLVGRGSCTEDTVR